MPMIGFCSRFQVLHSMAGGYATSDGEFPSLLRHPEGPVVWVGRLAGNDIQP